jgi:hypothetical protein
MIGNDAPLLVGKTRADQILVPCKLGKILGALEQ